MKNLEIHKVDKIESLEKINKTKIILDLLWSKIENFSFISICEFEECDHISYKQ